MFKIIILFLFPVFIGVQPVPTLAFQQCKKADVPCLNKNIDTIFKQSIKGDPDLGIKTLDPMHHDKVVGELGVIEYQLYNSTVDGFSNCDVVNTKLDLEKREFNFRIVCPLILIYGVYNISGTLIVMPIEGLGDYKIICTKDVLKFANVNWDPVAKLLQGPVFGANFAKITKEY